MYRVNAGFMDGASIKLPLPYVAWTTPPSIGASSRTGRTTSSFPLVLKASTKEDESEPRNSAVETRDTVRIFVACGYVVPCPIFFNANMYPRFFKGSKSPGFEAARSLIVSIPFVAIVELDMEAVPLADAYTLFPACSVAAF